jgi:hypothetical protein
VCEREEERERESARAGICMAISKRPGEPEGLDDSNAAFSCNLECLASQSRSPPPCGCGYDGCSLVGRGISTRPWNRAAAVAVVGELMSVVRCLVFCGRVESRVAAGTPMRSFTCIEKREGECYRWEPGPIRMDVDQHHALSPVLYVRSESKESTWQRAGSWLRLACGFWLKRCGHLESRNTREDKKRGQLS